MAKPQNPLDKFVTYTVHFELHAANSFNALRSIPTEGTNMATTEQNGVETLLINTRKDAHQIIDNVRFRYLSPQVDPSATRMAMGEVTLDVIEPNGMFFIEKIKNQAAKYQVSAIGSGMIFGLKIIFVGRLKDGSVFTDPLERIIPMQLNAINSNFTYKGGEHNLKLIVSSTGLTTSGAVPIGQSGLARIMAFTNKNVSFKAKTVQEAIPLLEQQLNKNYNDVYENELNNCPGAKPIRYRIILDPKITGDLTMVSKADTYRLDEKCHLTFTPTVDIGTMIKNILASSKEVNDMMASSQPKIGKQDESGVKMPMLQGSYHILESEIEILYRIVLYEGGGPVYEFDYFFTGEGKNVDVLEFETRFPNMYTWLSASVAGTELNRNANSTIPADHSKFWKDNSLHEDTTRRTLIVDPEERKCIPVLSGDVAQLPATNRAEQTGHITQQSKAVPSAKLAFETVGQIIGARNTQVSLTIRGHKDLLDKTITYPDGSDDGFGLKESLWAKVNIFNFDGSPFFYTGKYKFSTIDNSFSGGKFTQVLTLLMMNE